jgi:hypothetical protein
MTALAMSLNAWLTEMRDGLVTGLVGHCRTLADEALVLNTFIERTAMGGPWLWRLPD